MSDRLEPEPISRQDFLGIAGVGSAAAAVAFSTIGMLRLPKPRVLPDVSAVVRVGQPAEYPPGTARILSAEKIRVVCTEQGVAAMSLICTHLGCIVKESQSGFECPCHGSKFDPRGEVLAGPAPRALLWLAVSQAPDGTLLVDRAREVEAGEFYQA